MARQWPLPRGTFTITSRFAGRINPVTGRPESHSGTDFAVPDGTPFYACAGGTVQYIGAATGYGQWLVIDHPTSEGGGCTEYGHMWDAYATGLKTGDWVNAGQLIGYVGSNGQSTGPHLHLTVWEYGHGGRRIDPETWLAGAGYPGEAAPAPAPSDGPLFGVDVSEHQDGMSLRQAKAEGMAYAIIRTTDGTYRDRTYRSHLDDAESAGMLTAAYHYLRNPSEGTTVAQQVDASLAVMGDARRPVWIDVESPAGLHVDHIRECKRLYEAAGVRVIGVYSYVPYWEGRVAPSEPDSHEFGAFWVADYGRDLRGTPRALYPGNGHARWDYPLGNQKPVIWQYGSNAEVAGRLVDINAFRGSRAQLEALFTGRTLGEDWLAMASEEDVRRIIREEVWPVTHDTKRLCVQMGMDADDDGFANVPGWVQGGHRSFYDLLATAVSILEAIANKIGLSVKTRTFDTLVDPPSNPRNPKLKG
ncbi:peptidoglycan DD-metalloendopeptidase family protein [Dietzia aurantiaca]|uniref:peptidoglycan DD-metalloendopeptidase family protein n=1 Tax=Dietzia aurantiaca TaxID=983873 RepID=UPI001E2EE9D6|nr:peptidoglycan DD-metalloendopeptidase family protein [Dietzia aurantiaca]MCD2263686.1 peptidoglycan DD-metalloendopeptidase family protein [Dietzia aurantiaca]